MEYINDILNDDTIIGEIAARPGDSILHADFHAAALSLKASRHLVTIFAGDPHPDPHYMGDDSTTHLRLESEDIRQESDDIIATVAGWVIERGTNVIVSPANLTSHPAFRLAGTIAMHAALRAVADTCRTIAVLELHDRHGWQGNWRVANAHSDVPTPRSSVQPGEAHVPQHSTYSRRLIRGSLLTHHAEALFASQT